MTTDTHHSYRYNLSVDWISVEESTVLQQLDVIEEQLARIHEQGTGGYIRVYIRGNGPEITLGPSQSSSVTSLQEGDNVAHRTGAMVSGASSTESIQNSARLAFLSPSEEEFLNSVAPSHPHTPQHPPPPILLPQIPLPTRTNVTNSNDNYAISVQPSLSQEVLPAEIDVPPSITDRIRRANQSSQPSFSPERRQVNPPLDGTLPVDLPEDDESTNVDEPQPSGSKAITARPSISLDKAVLGSRSRSRTNLAKDTRTTGSKTRLQSKSSNQSNTSLRKSRSTASKADETGSLLMEQTAMSSDTSLHDHESRANQADNGLTAGSPFSVSIVASDRNISKASATTEMTEQGLDLTEQNLQDDEEVTPSPNITKMSLRHFTSAVHTPTVHSTAALTVTSTGSLPGTSVMRKTPPVAKTSVSTEPTARPRQMKRVYNLRSLSKRKLKKRIPHVSRKSEAQVNPTFTELASFYRCSPDDAKKPPSR